jgi:hypothetical protein
MEGEAECAGHYLKSKSEFTAPNLPQGILAMPRRKTDDLTLAGPLPTVPGVAAIRPDPRPATISGKPLRHEDRDLQLEY